MKLMSFVLLCCMTISLNCMNEVSEPPLLPVEIVDLIINDIFDKDFETTREVFDALDQASAFLMSNKFYWEQRDVLINALKRNLDLKMLDKVLVKAIKKGKKRYVDLLVNVGAVICRFRGDNSCRILIDIVKKKNRNAISLIMETLNKIIKKNEKNKDFSIEFVAFNDPIPKAKLVGGQRNYRALGQLPSLLKVALDNDLIQNIINEAHKNGLSQLVREIIFPYVDTKSTIEEILQAPIIIQEYLLDQAEKAGFLHEMLNYKITYRDVLARDTLVTYNMLQYAILNFPDQPTLIGTVENLLEYGKKVDSRQILEPIVVGDRKYHLTDIITKRINEIREIIQEDENLDPEDQKRYLRELDTYKKVEVLLKNSL